MVVENGTGGGTRRPMRYNALNVRSGTQRGPRIRTDRAARFVYRPAPPAPGDGTVGASTMQIDDVVYVTPEGLEKLRTELVERAEGRRHAIAARLQDAIKMGDLRENADYHAAKEDQAFNEGRIQELEALIRNASVIEAPRGNDVVAMGAQVTVAEDGEDDEETYRIVGAQEANPAEGLISNVSPIGSALLGARVGQVVTAQTPSGDVRFRIVAIG